MGSSKPSAASRRRRRHGVSVGESLKEKIGRADAGYRGDFQRGTRHVFELPGLEAALPDRDPVRNPDQFGVGKHGTGALAAIIEQHIDTGCKQGFV